VILHLTGACGSMPSKKKLGPENVRPKMSYGNAGPDPWDPVRGICDEPPERYFVENWLGGKDRQKQKSDRINICASIVAAVAGIAAVVIGLIALFR
jgi:hypothetical protein